MPSYKEYLEQIAKLQVLAERARQEEIAEARSHIGKLMCDYGLSLDDLLETKNKSTSVVRRSLVAQYRDPVSGKTWAGRGREPRWMTGKDRKEFLIK